MAEILIVDDEEAINELLKRHLKLIGHQCEQAFDGKEALEKINERHFDLILLDVMLPYISGFELIKKIKDIPVIFLTAKDGMEDKLEGLTSGAEDYVVKPFDMMELIARINIVLRRSKKDAEEIMIGELVVNLSGKWVSYKGELIELKPQEFALLEALINNRNLALSREKLLEIAWGFDYEGDTRTVDVHIQRIRKKLGLEDYLKTIYKVGYRLEI